jgi:hypothetical protein
MALAANQVRSPVQPPPSFALEGTGGAMPRSSRYGLPTTDDLPGTLQRSCREAQALFLEARREAIQAHGDGDDANRAAYAALKQKFEKCGDHWIAKAESAV